MHTFLILISFIYSYQIAQDQCLNYQFDKSEYINDCTNYQPNTNIHAFYYPWYSNLITNGYWRHWNHKSLAHWTNEVNSKYPEKRYVPPEDIGAPYYPLLGPYSCTDDYTLNEHMKYLRRSGVGVISISWYPPNMSDDECPISVDTYIPRILNIASTHNIKVTFHIEPYNNRNITSIRDNIIYIIDNYRQYKSFYLHDNKYPLLYLYDSYHIPTNEWKRLLSVEGDLSIRGTKYDSFMIGLYLNSNDCDTIRDAGFNGFYTYFSSKLFTYGSNYNYWHKVVECSNENKLIFIPSIGPGYNDTKLRPWNYHNTQPRKGGKYYLEYIKNVFGLFGITKYNHLIISITSFNEWGEGTQIEPVQMRMGYGQYQSDLFLNITCELYLSINEYKESIFPPITY